MVDEKEKNKGTKLGAKDKINEVNIVIHGAGSVVAKSNEESLDKCYDICDEVVHKMLGMIRGSEQEFEEKKKRAGIV